MAQTAAEHAKAIKATLDTLHRAEERMRLAIAAHHEALAAFAAEHGPEAGVGEELTTLAAVPKTPPSND